MTLAQLRSFLTVARLGSVKEAARSLAVSQPAVSGAVRVLRRELGDELYLRAGGTIELTPGGRRLASAASEILGLADHAARAVREAADDTTTLRVAATPDVAEFAADLLLEAFGHRHPHIKASLLVAPGTQFVRLITDRTVDIALGPRAGGASDPDIACEPFLRYRLLVVAAPGHALADSLAVAPAALIGTPWLLGPSEDDPSTESGAFLSRQAIAAQRMHTFPNYAAALAQVVAGRGITLAISHTVRDELDRGALCVLDVRGTPIHGTWYTSTLPAHRRTEGAEHLRHFVTLPDTTRVLLSRGGGVPGERFRARAPMHAGRRT